MASRIRTQTIISAVRKLTRKSKDVSRYDLAQAVLKDNVTEDRVRIRTLLQEAVRKGLVMKSGSYYFPVTDPSSAVSPCTSGESAYRQRASPGQGTRRTTTKRANGEKPKGRRGRKSNR